MESRFGKNWGAKLFQFVAQNEVCEIIPSLFSPMENAVAGIHLENDMHLLPGKFMS